MKKSYHFYENQTRKIMGKPPARVLYYSSSITLLVFIIAGFIAYIIPYDITEDFSATVSYQSAAPGRIETTSTHPLLDTIYQENNRYFKRRVTVSISADDIGKYTPQIGDTVTLYGEGYAYDAPIVIDKKIVNNDKVLIACEGTGVILSPPIILPSKATTIQINRGTTNYFSYILNI